MKCAATRIIHLTLDTVYLFYLLFQFWSHRHLYKDSTQESSKLSVKIPINPRFISERRIFSGSTLKTLQSDSKSLHWGSSTSTGTKTGASLGTSSREFSYRSPSEITLATSFNVPVDPVENTIDSYPTIRLVTQALMDRETESSSGSSGLSLPRSREQSEDEASANVEGDYRTEPEPVNDDALPPPDRVSTLSTESFKEPRLSLTLTLLLLTAVTVVSRI